MTVRVLRYTTNAVLALGLVLVVAALAVVAVIPRAVGGSSLNVLTGSMDPTIPPGSMVVIRPVDPGTLHVGDVVTFQPEPGKPTYVTHRIVAIDQTTTPVSLTTQGDANRGPDLKPVPVTAVRGRVWFHVPYLGSVHNAINGGSLGLLALLVFLVGYALTQLAGYARDLHRARQQQHVPASVGSAV